jgi:hypothetical protein
MTLHRMREFPVHTTRMGDNVAHYRFPVKCHQCGFEKEFISVRALPDTVVRKKFQQWGWVLGRNRSYDVCPRCIGVENVNKLAIKYKVNRAGISLKTPAEIAGIAQATRDQVGEQTDSLIAKHFPPVESLKETAREHEAPAVESLDFDPMVTLRKTELLGMEYRLFKMDEELSIVLDRLDNIGSAMELILDVVSKIEAGHSKVQVQALPDTPNANLHSSGPPSSEPVPPMARCPSPEVELAPIEAARPTEVQGATAREISKLRKQQLDRERYYRLREAQGHHPVPKKNYSREMELAASEKITLLKSSQADPTAIPKAWGDPIGKKEDFELRPMVPYRSKFWWYRVAYLPEGKLDMCTGLLYKTQESGRRRARQ